MLITKLSDFNELDYVNLSKAIHFLNSTDLAQTPLGRSHQRDESFYCQTLEYMTEDIDDFNFEIHQRRLDLHYVVEGEEEIDVSIDAHPQLLGEYNSDRDLQYVKKPKSYNKIILHTGDFILIGLHEPHRTNGLVNRSTHVRKIVLKMGK
ncbi:YhcH/YjgK/YiaL family protein [Oenococcus oeni]|uniref:YhcH/YjgK/YiaL family protein n=1 Tax=Oenococcus oeni TaxID=1247 RepID=UPI000277B8A7|nr:YhcH/YjgK/YiaL family protein [Oenococcus oeni]EJN98971.1 putative beta-D-galactosidase [Oenococcus oeni AWRIB418]KGH56724.1 beta-D-galactosidase [Oenococcus oeni IOEB_B10]KGH63314.1 beta-D-galactosidase [Oenococcus oeni S13]QGR01596.1 DUF386 domain-containing protein [Oenococcus oeni]TEU22172.1 DUF386 domain-containing protein [Oenococcus oeni]